MRSILVSFLFILLAVIPASGQRKIEVSRQFVVMGEVEKQIVFDIAAIKKYPAIALGDVVIKNHRGQDKKTAKNVKGVLLKTLLDSVRVTVAKPKYYSELVVVLTATDGYKNVYSWNELVNTEVGNHVYVVTEKDGENIEIMDESIVVISTADINPGSRYLRGLSKLEIKRVE